MSNVKLVLDSDEEQKVERLKTEYGIKQTTELIRFLITYQYKTVTRNPQSLEDIERIEANKLDLEHSVVNRK